MNISCCWLCALHARIYKIIIGFFRQQYSWLARTCKSYLFITPLAFFSISSSLTAFNRDAHTKSPYEEINMYL